MANEQLNTLVSQVLTDREQGKELPLDTYCTEVPHLLDDLRNRVEAPRASTAADEWGTQASLSPPSSPSGDRTQVGEAAAAQALSVKPPPRRPRSGYPEIPGYEILGELGRGGMGVVYKARHVGLKRTVALKMIKSGLYAGETELLRFQAEAEAAARLQHPNIVQIYEFEAHEDNPYFALEYVEGGTLGRFMDGKPQPERDAAHVVETLARAIHFAHQRGVLHRDLKPVNILLSMPGVGQPAAWGARGPATLTRGQASLKSVPDKSLDDKTHAVDNEAEKSQEDKASLENLATMQSLAPGQAAIPEAARETPTPAPVVTQALTALTPKITDFGLAKLMEVEGTEKADASDFTPTGAFLGTPSYMAPEQAKTGRTPIGPGADVYGLGGILYVMLTGRPPFLAATPMETVMQVLNEEPVSPRSLRPALSRDIETICLRCLEKDAARRYVSAEALADDLRRYLNHEPIHARPAGTIERAMKWARRRPALAALLVLGLVSVCVLAFLNYHLVVARRLEHEAREQEKAARELAQKREAQALAEEKKAHENFVLAAQAVDEFFTKVSDHPHLKDFDLEDLRMDLLQAAQRYHHKFVERKSDDPRVRAEQGKATLRLARLLNEAGQTKEALRNCEQAEAIFEPLVTGQPGEAVYLRGWGESWNRLAAIEAKLNHPDKALAAIQKAISIREELLTNPDARPQDRADLATSLNNLAAFLGGTVKKDQALPLYQRARDLQRQLVEVEPKHPTFQSDLARTHYNLAYQFHVRGAMKEAFAEYAEAARLWKELVVGNPRPGPALPLLATCLHNMAGLALDKSPAEANKLYQEAEAILRHATERHPSIPSYRLRLANTYLGLAHAARASGDDKNALPHLQEAVKHQKRLVADAPKNVEFQAALAKTCREVGDQAREPGERILWYTEAITFAGKVRAVSPDHKEAQRTLLGSHWSRALLRMEAADYKQALYDWRAALVFCLPDQKTMPRWQTAKCLARLGLHAAAAAEADAVFATFGKPQERYDFARLFSLCLAGAAADPRLEPPQREEAMKTYTVKALGFLQRARLGGLFEDPTRWEQFLADPDFAPLHARPEYKAWLSEETSLGQDKGSG